MQLASVLEGREALVVDAQRDRGLLVLGHVHRPRSRRPARPRSSRPRRPRASTRCRRSRARSRRPCVSSSVASRTIPITIQGRIATISADVDEPPHGPGGVSAGSQPLRGDGAEPSGGGCTAPPGQWRRMPRSKPVEALGAAAAPSSVLSALRLGRAEDRHDAGVVAVGVVVARHLAELGEPAGQVGRVVARVLDHRLGAVERADRAREDAGAVSARQPRLLRRQLDQVVVRARLADQRRAGRRSSAARRPPAGAARGRRARARAWPASTRPRAARGRRASRAGSRTSCWPCAACPAAAPARAGATRSRRRSRGTWRWC